VKATQSKAKKDKKSKNLEENNDFILSKAKNGKTLKRKEKKRKRAALQPEKEK